MHSMNNILTIWMRISSSVNQLTNSNIAYKYNWLQNKYQISRNNDLNIIQHESLRKVISHGPKFRELHTYPEH
jgi:hypothetical protein